MEKSYTIKDVAETQKIAKQLLRIVKDKKIKIVLLIGELGSGKTTLVKYIAKELGVEKTITSPTFLISKEYRVGDSRLELEKKTKSKSQSQTQISNFVHYDLYRLRTHNELAEIGFEEKMADKNNLIVIEWPDKINGLKEKLSKKFKNQILTIKFYHTKNKNQRKIKIIE